MPRAVLLSAVLVIYDLSCYLSTTHSLPALAAGLALSPALLVLGGIAWRSLGRGVAAMLLVVCVAAMWALWPSLVHNAAMLLLVQQLTMWGLLCLMFARTLRAGHTPLCSEWADRLHGPLTAAERRYSRRVTLAWSLFFAAMGLTGALLFLFASPRSWSAFNNLWSLPLIAAMFLGEYLVRHVVLPDTAHAGLLAALRLYAARR